MAEITIHGNLIHTNGQLPSTGHEAPDFVLTSKDLKDMHLKDFRGKNIILNIFPSLDTSVCAASVRRFNKESASLNNTVVLAISRDLPFAHERFCTAEGIENVVTLSEMRDYVFGDRYGIRQTEGPLKGLLARAVVVIDKDGIVRYTQLVPEIAKEPDYEEVLKNISLLQG